MKKNQNFLGVQFSVYLNGHVFVMIFIKYKQCCNLKPLSCLYKMCKSRKIHKTLLILLINYVGIIFMVI